MKIDSNTSICLNMFLCLSPGYGRGTKSEEINFFKIRKEFSQTDYPCTLWQHHVAPCWVYTLQPSYLFLFQNLNLDQLTQYAQTEMNLTSFRLAENFVPDLQVPAHSHRLEYITLFDSLLTIYHGVRSYYYQKGSCHWLGEDAIYSSIQRVSNVYL